MPNENTPSDSPDVPGDEGDLNKEGDAPLTSRPASTSPPGWERSASRLSSPNGPSTSMDTVERVVRFLLWSGGLALAGWLLWYFAGLVVYLVVGGVLAYLLRPIVDRIQGTGLARVPSILVTFLLFLVGVTVVVTSIVPFVGRQVHELTQLINVQLASDVATYIEDRIRAIAPIDKGVLVENIKQMAEALRRGDLVRGEQVAQTVGSVLTVFTNIVYAVVVIPFVTFFLLKDGLQIRRKLLGFVPNRYFEVALAIVDKVEANIGRYFQALLVQCTSIAIIASILLGIVGLQNAIAVGIFTGLANTIPYFGPFLGFVLGALVGIAQTGDLVFVPWVALAMILTQLADNVLLQPLIFSRAAKAHPLVILFVVLIGARLGGIVGMLVAIPLTTTVRVVAEQLLWSLRNYRILRASS